MVAVLFSPNHAPPTQSKFTVLNWNANSIYPYSLELENFPITHDVDIACITETRLKPTKKLRFNNFEWTVPLQTEEE